MAGRLKRAVLKVIVRCKDRYWEDCLAEIIGRYRAQPGTDGKSASEVLFGIRPRFAIRSPQLELVALNINFSKEFEVAIAKSLKASRTAIEELLGNLVFFELAIRKFLHWKSIYGLTALFLIRIWGTIAMDFSLAAIIGILLQPMKVSIAYEVFFSHMINDTAA